VCWTISPTIPGFRPTEYAIFSAAFYFPRMKFSSASGSLRRERNRYALLKMLLHPANFCCSTNLQSFGYAAQRCAAGSTEQIHRHGGLRLPRPLLYRQTSHSNLRSRRWKVESIPQLHTTVRKQGGAEKLQATIAIILYWRNPQTAPCFRSPH